MSKRSSLEEERMKQMRDEIFRLRRAVLSFVPDPYRRLLVPPHQFTLEEGRDWDEDVARQIIELVKPNEHGVSPCPLCGDKPQSFGSLGFSIPVGLERHLLGLNGSRECSVMYAAKGAHRRRHLELYPSDHGMRDFE